ncbi:UDP-3-O-acyl-N-acetylglucosamine deacetylase [Desulfonema limicola]|uniref:UDP-3-O-acyl-N-acetylglucosamine deacetylase n=1 Tax=Desulfonema limicola TaxID=45656 RepID=A0A975BCB3_9BACT|nr:UDP-3-O-acyl-N-acetylglucosamine deacetylase [Desulfonema limicola]QTA82984.1 UDP-3-O-acyl-N-acetylglucosamine deacetylase [Desulfonema limicola]
MYLQQRTLAKSVSCSGVGVHSGKKVNLTIKPAPVNHGIKFSRTDLPDSPKIPALFNNVVDTSLATVIGCDGCIVSTIEHLMASFAGLSVDNALVEIDNYELPIMDGSAGHFTDMIMSAGCENQTGPKCFFVIKKPIALKDGDKSVTAYPAQRFKITCTIDFPHPLIKKQSFSLDVSDEIFQKQIARARTFGFYHEVEYMKRLGLARGGSLDNAVVIGKDSVMNKGGLRFKDEFVRHKILDCIGDFSLLGMPILGHIVVNRSGHAFNHAFLKEFFIQKSSWETLTIHDISDIRSFKPKAIAI